MEELKQETIGELKASVDSVVDNKNHLAHGDPGEITYGRAKRYFEDTVKVVELIERQVSPG